MHVYDNVDASHADGACHAFMAVMQELEDVFSTFKPASAISRINRGELDIAGADPIVSDVFDACTWLDHSSGGAFRAHRPGTATLDPAGFVKGWAAERAAQQLTAAGLQHWCINIGGDVLTRGAPAVGVPWRVAIVDPHDDHSIIATVAITSGAVATSGLAQRGAHLWDGRDGSIANGAASVTVVGPSLTWADSFATTVYAMGAAGIAWLTRFDDYDALVVTNAREMLTTPGFTAPTCGVERITL